MTLQPVRWRTFDEEPELNRDEYIGDVYDTTRLLGYEDGLSNIYAEVDLEMKGRALAKCDVGETNLKEHHWNKDRTLMAFLRSL